MDEKSKKSIRERVLEEIEGGKAVMRPRWHFVLKTALVVVGAVVLSLAILYVASFVMFVLRQTGAWFAPSFGFPGVGVLLRSVPWVLVLAVALFGMLLEILAKKYSCAYRTPLLYSAGGVLLLVLVGGFLIPYIGVHPSLMHFVMDHDVPIMRPLYEEYGRKGPGEIHPGTITGIREGIFEIEDRFGEPVTVFVASSTRFPLGEILKEGDRIVILGERNEEGIRAFGVREVDEIWEFGPRMRMHMPPVK